MRVRRISLRNFAGVEESEVTFPADGVTVIEGENEAGKSSLLQALDAIIEYADNSASRKIKDLVPVGRDVGPEVEVEIETGDYAFTYRKRWVRDRETVLEINKPSHQQLTGRDAHDRVSEIVRDTLDADLWKALRLDQGTALEQATFEGSALGRALDAASGGDATGDHEDALWDRIEVEYARYWTKTGKPKEDLASAAGELDDASEAAADARAHMRSLDDDSAEVARLTAQADVLETAANDAETEARELEVRRGEVTETRQALDAAVAQRSLALAAFEKARSNRERRADQVEAVETAEDALEEIEREASEAEPERDVLTTAVASADEEGSAARRSLEAAQSAREQARRDAEFRRWEIEVVQLRGRRTRVDEARKELTDAAGTIEAIVIDEESLGEIEQAYLRVVELGAAVDRALPVVHIEAKSEIALTIDGTDAGLSAGEAREITTHGRTEVVLPGVIEFVVTAGSDGTDIVEESEQAVKDFVERCQRAGVSGFEEARSQFDLKTDAERTRTLAHDTITRDLDDLTFEELVHKVDSLTSRIAGYLDTRGDEPELPPDHSAAQEAEKHAQEILDKAIEAAEHATQSAATARGRLNDLEMATAGREGKLEIARNAVTSASAVLEAARKELSDEAITMALEDVRKASDDAERVVVDLEKQLRNLDAGTLDALLENAMARRNRSRTDLTDLVERRKELEIGLRIETERGPARLLDEAETTLVEAERRHEAIDRRAAAASLLYRTFKEHRSKARRRYIKPFRDEIERLGRIVFGTSFEVSLAEDLSVESRTRDGETLSFHQLSTGAREQLGVLSRLACAMLVSDDGGVPVVLDDALGWTDPARLDRMGAAISTAADDCQVIILTCVPERYAGVGKARTIRV